MSRLMSVTRLKPRLRVVRDEPEPARSGPSEHFIGLTRKPDAAGEGWPIKRTQETRAV